VVEEVSYEGSDMTEKHIVINAKYVNDKIGAILAKEDLSKFIL
jgi:ATP-dependent protease HslVU (ClpYQ) ATPase subunit